MAAALSWGPLWPLARMSYLAFLLHQPLIYLEVSLYTHPVELSAFSQVISSCFVNLTLLNIITLLVLHCISCLEVMVNFECSEAAGPLNVFRSKLM